MRKALLLHLCSAAFVLGSGILWLATGREGFTRWPNEKLASSDAPPAAGEGELLSQIGFTESGDGAAAPDIESRFALGLLPGGLEPWNLLSVALAAAIGASMSGVAIVGGRIAGRRASAHH